MPELRACSDSLSNSSRPPPLTTTPGPAVAPSSSDAQAHPDGATVVERELQAAPAPRVPTRLAGPAATAAATRAPGLPAAAASACAPGGALGRPGPEQRGRLRQRGAAREPEPGAARGPAVPARPRPPPPQPLPAQRQQPRAPAQRQPPLPARAQPLHPLHLQALGQQRQPRRGCPPGRLRGAPRPRARPGPRPGRSAAAPAPAPAAATAPAPAPPVPPAATPAATPATTAAAATAARARAAGPGALQDKRRPGHLPDLPAAQPADPLAGPGGPGGRAGPHHDDHRHDHRVRGPEHPAAQHLLVLVLAVAARPEGPGGRGEGGPHEPGPALPGLAAAGPALPHLPHPHVLGLPHAQQPHQPRGVPHSLRRHARPVRARARPKPLLPPRVRYTVPLRCEARQASLSWATDKQVPAEIVDQPSMRDRWFFHKHSSLLSWFDSLYVHSVPVDTGHRDVGVHRLRNHILRLRPHTHGLCVAKREDECHESASSRTVRSRGSIATSATTAAATTTAATAAATTTPDATVAAISDVLRSWQSSGGERPISPGSQPLASGPRLHGGDPTTTTTPPPTTTTATASPAARAPARVHVAAAAAAVLDGERAARGWATKRLAAQPTPGESSQSAGQSRRRLAHQPRRRQAQPLPARDRGQRQPRTARRDPRPQQRGQHQQPSRALHPRLSSDDAPLLSLSLLLRQLRFEHLSSGWMADSALSYFSLVKIMPNCEGLLGACTTLCRFAAF